MSSSTQTLDRVRQDAPCERASVERMLRGIALVRSLSGHDTTALRRAIETATWRLAAADHPAAEVQRLRNYARTMCVAAS
jgi:DNA-binding FadR family transcriptional regulator